MLRAYILFCRAALAVLPLAALSLATPAAHAQTLPQTLLYTLSGVTFEDGATASGYFIVDREISYFTDFNITTTDGTMPMNGTNIPTGYNYTPATTFINEAFADRVFRFVNAIPPGFFTFRPSLSLGLLRAVSSPGTYTKLPGIASGPRITGSGEFTDSNSRGITGGSLIVTDAAAAAPEPGSIALVLTAAVPVAGLVRRRKKH